MIVRRQPYFVSHMLVLALAACQPGPGSSPESTAETPTPSGVPDPEAAAFAESIEKAHGLAAWHEKGAFRAGIVVEFGGATMLEGEMLMTPDMRRTRVERADGSVVVWDGSNAWVSPADAEFPMARFHALTWPYFLSAPTKLRDPGTYLEPLGERVLQGETYDAARLTFGAGIGDTPDDWYVVYKARAAGHLHALAYIVTYGTTVTEAEAEPHAVTYGEFETIDRVQIPTRWTFWLWSEDHGIHGDPIGAVTLTDAEFVEPSSEAFAVSEDARREELPSS